MPGNNMKYTEEDHRLFEIKYLVTQLDKFSKQHGDEALASAIWHGAFNDNNTFHIMDIIHPDPLIKKHIPDKYIQMFIGIVI